MSDKEPIPGDARNESTTTSVAGGKPKKPRSTAERAVVWGAIAVGAVLIVTEGWPRARYSLDFQALDNAVMEMEQSADKGVTESQAQQLMSRYSSHDVQKNLPSNELASPRVDTYKYRGLLSERAIYVYYGHTREGEEAEVLAVRTQPAEFVHATAPTDELQPQSIDTSPVAPPATEAPQAADTAEPAPVAK